MNSMNSSRRMKRKRGAKTSSLLFTSAAFAISISCAGAFQNAFTTTQTTSNVRERVCSSTKLNVITDPRQILRENGERVDMNALEDIYLLTTEGEGLSGNLIETAPGDSSLNEDDGNPKRIQFRGVSNTVDKRSRSKSLLGRAAPIRPKSSLKSTPTKATSRARSSTMPGFMERSSSDRQKAYRDGIKIAEQRSGKKFVDTSESKKKRRQINGESMYKSSASVPDSMLQFANEIHEVERITPTEEIILGEKTQEAIRLQSVYDNLVNQLDREPTDDEWCAASGKINMEALTQAIEEGLEAKNKLVESNLRMVQGVVNVYIRNGLQGQYNAGDLMQEGIMVRSVSRYEDTLAGHYSY